MGSSQGDHALRSRENGSIVDTGPAIVADSLTKRYGDVLAVDDISVEIDQGTVVGLLGPNGAGKTTLIKCLLGLIEPTSGRATVADVDVGRDPTRAYRSVGAMLEGARNVYWRLTVRENLRFFSSLAGTEPAVARDRHDELLERFDLLEKADTAVNDLSQGMKQKVSLACTLSRDVPIVFLDEPTLGLDVESSLGLRRELRRLVDEESLTVVLSSHDMDVIADLADRVLVIDEGSIITDDSVSGLLELFRTQEYELVTDGLSADRLLGVLAEYNPSVTPATSERVRVTVTMGSGDELYPILGRLLDAGGHVVSVSATEPTLAEAFLRITDGDDSARKERLDRPEPAR